MNEIAAEQDFTWNKKKGRQSYYLFLRAKRKVDVRWRWILNIYKRTSIWSLKFEVSIKFYISTIENSHFRPTDRSIDQLKLQSCNPLSRTPSIELNFKTIITTICALYANPWLCTLLTSFVYNTVCSSYFIDTTV